MTTLRAACERALTAFHCHCEHGGELCAHCGLLVALRGEPAAVPVEQLEELVAAAEEAAEQIESTIADLLCEGFEGTHEKAVLARLRAALAALQPEVKP